MTRELAAAGPGAARRGGRGHRSHRGRRARAWPSWTTSARGAPWWWPPRTTACSRPTRSPRPAWRAPRSATTRTRTSPPTAWHLGEPGRSLALEMAERLGLPADGRAGRARAPGREGGAGRGAAQEAGAGPGRAAPRAGAHRRRACGRCEDEQERLRGRRAGGRGAKKRTELETFTRELRRRGEEAARKAADAIREAVQRVAEAPRLTPAAAAKARGPGRERDPRGPGGGARRCGRRGGGARAARGALAVGGRVQGEDAGRGGRGAGPARAGRGSRSRWAASACAFPRARAASAIGGLGQRARRPRRSAPLRRGHATRARRARSEINLVGLTVDEALPAWTSSSTRRSWPSAAGARGPRLRRGPPAPGGGRAARGPPARVVASAWAAPARAAAASPSWS